MTAAPNATGTLPMTTVWRYGLSGLITSIAFSLMIPLGVVTLAERGHSAADVGVFAMLPYLVIMLTMPFAAHVRNKIGRGRTFLLGLAVGVAQMVGFATTDSFALWCVFAALGGVYAALLWGLTDTLIAENAPSERVGAITGLYQTLLGGALMLGPALPSALSLDFQTGSFAAVALMSLAFAPVVTLGQRAIDEAGNTDRGGASIWPLFGVAPVLVGAAFLGGLFESGVNAMGALHALHIGFAVPTAALVVTVIAAGSLMVQYPLGKLADRITLKPLLMVSAVLLFASSAILPFTAAQPMLIWVVAATWGAVGGGLYTLILVHIAHAYRGVAVAAATMAAVVAYTTGNIVGPGLGGLAMELSPELGLPALLLTLSAAMIAVIAFGRDMRKEPTVPSPQTAVCAAS